MTTTIDAATFKALQDTAGTEFVADLVKTYLEEAPAMIADLEASRAAGEADRFRRAAHSLKSNSKTFGADALAALAKELELAGLAKVKEMKPDPLGALREEFGRVATALKDLAGA
jgi:HPt (histidine-containing phosphotransfer) domain-containing protein